MGLASSSSCAPAADLGAMPLLAWGPVGRFPIASAIEITMNSSRTPKPSTATRCPEL